MILYPRVAFAFIELADDHTVFGKSLIGEMVEPKYQNILQSEQIYKLNADKAVRSTCCAHFYKQAVLIDAVFDNTFFSFSHS